MRKILLLLLAVACLYVLPTPVLAETLGSVQVKLDTGELPVVNGGVSLYQVGIKVEEGYRIREGFGGGIVHQEDADSDKLAQWLAESAGENGISLLLDADGQAVFSELEEGLYMLIQTERTDGFYPIYPILFTVPEEDQWDVKIYREPVPVVTELPKTGQSSVPFFGILGMVLSSTGLLLCTGKNRKR